MEESKGIDWKLEVVMIPVVDVDRAKHFYSEQAGFNVDHDHVMSDTLRIVQLTPPGSACSIAFGMGFGDGIPGSVSGLQLVVTDINAARSALLDRGVDVSPVKHMSDDGTWAEGEGGDWNSFVFFDDPDGNGWSVQQAPVHR